MLVMQNPKLENIHKHTNQPRCTNTENTNTHTHSTHAYSVSAGAREVYGHRTRGGAVVRQEVIKAVEVSGGA